MMIYFYLFSINIDLDISGTRASAGILHIYTTTSTYTHIYTHTHEYTYYYYDIVYYPAANATLSYRYGSTKYVKETPFLSKRINMFWILLPLLF